jgi:hypothetical protein
MTVAKEKRHLERLLAKLDHLIVVAERAREHVLDLLGEADRAELAGQPDAITVLMEQEGIGFKEAVERLSAERGQ